MDEDIKVILAEIEKMGLTQQEITDFKAKLAEYSEGGKSRVLAGELEEYRYKYNAEWAKMTMERRAKYIQTLLLIMKKISQTQDTIIDNLK